MPSLKLEFTGFDEMLKKLNQLNADTKSIAEAALVKTFDIVTEKAEQAVQPANLPAKGEFSTGGSEKSLVTTPRITWSGTQGSVKVGFNIKKGGLPTIFMMYGTPRYMKNQKMYDAFFGTQTQGEIAVAQKEVFEQALEKIL